MSGAHGAEHGTAAGGGAEVERAGRALDEWRGRIDELRLQLDLASMDVRDQLRERLDVAENAYLAAKAGLGDARRDTAAGLRDARLGVEQLLHDLERAYEAAEAAVQRAAR
ncbi:MAG: hypothetical protein M0029_05530 [Actinomycetota bacterium]|nr:hypothetical protein [Actinomycetota bacterium]